MTDLLSALTTAAVTAFRTRRQSAPNAGFVAPDPILAGAQRAAFELIAHHPVPGAEVENLVSAINSDSDFEALQPIEGELEPMILTPGGGFRSPLAGLINSLFMSAMLQMYFLRLPIEEAIFVRTVMEGFEELRRAVRGEEIRCYVVSGYSGISLPEGKSVSTPWGTVRPSPSNAGPVAPFQQQGHSSTCILAEQRLVPVILDRSASPTHTFDNSITAVGRAEYLMPLAFALASEPDSDASVPVLRWSTFILPFQFGFGFSSTFNPPIFKLATDYGDRLSEVEEWSRTVESKHAHSIDTAARRLVSAIGHRTDRSDALVDAVVVWENLVGTSAEVTFRVSAALAKLIETDASKRKSLKKELSKIYSIRSRVVHGEAVDAADVNDAATKAVNYAVMALRKSYTHTSDWLALSSSERSDQILLEWP